MILRALLVTLIAAAPIAGDDNPPPPTPDTMTVRTEVINALVNELLAARREAEAANANYERAFKNWQTCEASRRT